MAINTKGLKFLEYFEELNQIPRCSGNETEISNYLKRFGENLGLEVLQDELLNIVIRKPATRGYENSPGIIIQGHMDMVCEKDNDSDHDFLKDPIRIIEEDGYLIADKTTLGADDGIAIAMGMAILADETLKHPEIELFVTTSEETDMSGALGISNDLLRGKMLINIDSEEEGILTVGSAGGVTIIAEHDIVWEDADKKGIKLLFEGFKGGHSGMEINKNRGNILKVMAYFLKELSTKTDFRISSFTAGTLDNAIPRSGEIELTFSEIENIESVIESIKEQTIKQFSEVDGELIISLEMVDKVDRVWSMETTNDVIDMIQDMPTGVNTFVKDTDSVESSNNLASIRDKKGVIYLENSVRSSSDKIKNDLATKCAAVFEEHNFSYKMDMEYPGWEFSDKSALKDLAEELYLEMYGKKFETIIVHAGLECGAIASKYPDMDMISIGPNIKGAHTPKESMEIESAIRVYDFIVELIAKI